MRPADQDMTVIEKVVCYSPFPRGGGMPHHSGPHKQQHQSGGRRKGENVGKSPHCGFCRKVQVSQSEQAQDWPV